MPFLSHVQVGISDFERARRFYEAILGELGLCVRDCAPATGWMSWRARESERPLFIIGGPWNKQMPAPGNGPMSAFLAPSRDVVDRCYVLALACGGADEGPPGLRPHYHAHHCDAYFRDPDGNKLCVVRQEPDDRS